VDRVGRRVEASDAFVDCSAAGCDLCLASLNLDVKNGCKSFVDGALAFIAAYGRGSIACG
jgi:hypothetical protein